MKVVQLVFDYSDNGETTTYGNSVLRLKIVENYCPQVTAEVDQSGIDIRTHVDRFIVDVEDAFRYASELMKITSALVDAYEALHGRSTWYDCADMVEAFQSLKMRGYRFQVVKSVVQERAGRVAWELTDGLDVQDAVTRYLIPRPYFSKDKIAAIRASAEKLKDIVA
jgi:hypothetical protein